MDSGVFRDVVVTSDSIEILNMALNYQATGVVRPQHLASDTSQVKYAVQHALKQMESSHKYDYVQLLQPVTPLVEPVHIGCGMSMLLTTKADIVISVCRDTEGLGISRSLNFQKSMKGFLPKEYRVIRRQTTPKKYRLNNCIFVGKAEVFREGKDYYCPEVNSLAYIMPKEVSIDIDDEHDLFIADALLRKKHGEVPVSSQKPFWKNLFRMCLGRR